MSANQHAEIVSIVDKLTTVAARHGAETSKPGGGSKIRLRAVETDLLEAVDRPADLIVFNPPWIPGRVDSALDRALFYDDDLFARFFEQAHRGLAADGRLLLVFSSVLRLLRPDTPHPIEAELEHAGRFTLEARLQRKVKSPNRRRTKERVELWVLSRVP